MTGEYANNNENVENYVKTSEKKEKKYMIRS